ncbi:MAG TPA: class I SAM-dependent methyltransferase [Pseudonocardiaceae bacterium]|nr:class I SAM-dependent methyltransferase [Pseudonocardiaceae bacterium]
MLDSGGGTGEHTIHLAALGYDVRGVDSSEHAIEQARTNATGRNVAARFEVADALRLGEEPTYDTVIDSALFHIFDLPDRDRYVRSLYRACRPAALVHVLALSDTGPGFGPPDRRRGGPPRLARPDPPDLTEPFGYDRPGAFSVTRYSDVLAVM